MTKNSNPTLELTSKLISRPSVTPDDAGCQILLAERLEPLGFVLEHLRFEDVDNLWARRGSDRPLLVFAGHTDVVPTGPLEAWESGPFQPEIRGDYLYGRGAADMKASLAAMITATERFISEFPSHKGSIGFLFTSDEEGPAVNGTVKVIEHLVARNEDIDWCLVGEPSSEERLGDVIKIGRRGSTGATLRINGIQGHVAYPHKAANPIIQALPALRELCETVWCQGNKDYPPTSFQITNINAGTGAVNVIPGSLEVLFNFRFSTQVGADELHHKTEQVLDRHDLSYEIDWWISGQPFLTRRGEFTESVSQAIREVEGLETELSTTGGTSDGRFIAPTGAQVIELGPTNHTIHKVNECVRVDDLEILSNIYQRLMTLLLT